MLFSRPKRAVGIDVGSHSVKAIQMSRSGGRVRVDGAGYALVDRNQLNVDSTAALAGAMREAVRGISLQQSVVVGALQGQTVVIRYPRLPEMAEEQLGEAIDKEAGQHIPYELSEVFLDWTLLDSVSQGEEKLLKVLLVAAKHEVIDARVQIAGAADIQLSILGVDSLALADAAEVCDFLRVGETVALVNIGLSSTSVHFVKDGVSNFIRDVNWGARELIQALTRARRCDYEIAEKLLREAGVPRVEVPEPPPEEPLEAEQEQKPSTGASLLDPFEDELGSAPAAPVAAAAPSKDEKSVEEILTPPLTRLVNEIRRSFEYYEHELYESTVDRIILSGGIAHLPLLCKTLSDELGVKGVEVANPGQSALFMGNDFAVGPMYERPAQFMVAVGLAARGMAEL